MRVRQNGSSGHKTPGGESGSGAKPVIAGLASSTASERLEYIAAMVQELKVMAAEGDHRTLTGLLDLAHQEALLRRQAEE